MPPKNKSASGATTETKKERKQRLLRQETELLRARKAVLDAANANADHMSILPAFGSFKSAADADGRVAVDVKITFAHGAQLDAGVVDECFAMLKRNMEQHYVTSYGEWSDKLKRAELNHADARYLLVRDAATGALVGFCHVRFEWEEHDVVLYVMEIQLEDSVRRRGLGKRLMQTLELIARKNALDAVALTVLGSDTDARRFYDRLGYGEVYSPDREVDGGGVPEGEHPHSYAVLVKSFRPPVPHVHSASCSHDHDHPHAHAATTANK
jgi:ribosomal protein S18 acetylase RimI-like enzyme